MVNARLNVFELPLVAVLRVTLRADNPALAATVQFAATAVSVGVPVTEQLTPSPETVMLDTPARPAPFSVIATS